jgi:hypothetical protein
MALFVKNTSTCNCSGSQIDDISLESGNRSSTLPDFLEPMELQHSPVAVRNPLGSLLARFPMVREAICSFPPKTFITFTSPCLFLRLAMEYLLCTILCWILSSICALASGSACTVIHQTEEDDIIQEEVEVPLSEQVCFLILFVLWHLYIIRTFPHERTNLKTSGTLNRYVLFSFGSCILILLSFSSRYLTLQVLQQ